MLPEVASPAVADPVPAADRALPGASKSSAARGRDVDSPSSALPGANKSARGRSVPLAAAMASVPAESALPGAYKSRAARGRDVFPLLFLLLIVRCRVR